MNTNSEQQQRQKVILEANRQLGSVLGMAGMSCTFNAGDGSLKAALNILAEVQKLKFVDVALTHGGDVLRRIARASGLQVRKVTLESGWWKYETVPCIGFLIPSGAGGSPNVADADLSDEEIVELGTPVAILCKSNGTMYYVHPFTGAAVVINNDNSGLSRLAFHFFYAFDDTRPVKIWDVIRLGSHRCGYTLVIIFIAGLLIGLIGLIPPIMQKWIIGQVPATAGQFFEKFLEEV